jgi:hypothetical protein
MASATGEHPGDNYVLGLSDTGAVNVRYGVAGAGLAASPSSTAGSWHSGGP